MNYSPGSLRRGQIFILRKRQTSLLPGAEKMNDVTYSHRPASRRVFVYSVSELRRKESSYHRSRPTRSIPHNRGQLNEEINNVVFTINNFPWARNLRAVLAASCGCVRAEFIVQAYLLSRLCVRDEGTPSYLHKPLPQAYEPYTEKL